MPFNDLRALGLNVIPCAPKSKKPKVDWLPYQESQCNIPLSDSENAAVICGKTSGNLVVIDIDVPEKLNKFFSDFESIKNNTLVVQTGSGGYHIYMRATDELPRIMFMVDETGNPMGEIRGQGAYVVAPGSIHPDTGQPYKVISNTTNINTFQLSNLTKALDAKGIHVKRSLPPINEIFNEVPIGNRDNATFKYAAHLIGTVGLNYEDTLAAVTLWSEKLGFEKIHVSAVKSAWKRVKRAVTVQPEIDEEVIKSLRDLSSNDEGKEVHIEALVAVTDKYQTVTTEITANCKKCDISKTIRGNGYENPQENVKCSTCGNKMYFDESTKKTNDVMDIMLEEFSSEVEQGKLISYDAKVFGKDVKTTFDNQRTSIIAKYKSLVNADKKSNNPVLLVQKIDPMDEPVTAQLSPEEFSKFKNMARDNPTEYLKKLSRSYAPHIKGNYDDPKLLILMFLVFGSEGTTRRIQSSMLFIGNPGQGKSELLKKVKQISNKGAYVVGVTTSAAGMASGMVKLANGTSVVRPGVLPRYSGGHVAADEFDKFKPEDRKACLECMEQGTVTFTKSGVEEEREAKTGIIAGCNPIYGDWDWKSDPLENINLESYTVQRFDILWNFVGRSDMEESDIAASILGINRREDDEILQEDELRRLLNSARELKPQLKESAKKMIHQYYMQARKKTSDKDTLPMDRRQLEGLIRMSGEIAKLQLKDEIEECDVQEVIRLHKNSLMTFGIDTRGDMRQMRMVDDTHELSFDEKLGKVLFKIMNSENHFEYKDFKHECMQENMFKSIESFDKFWTKEQGNKFLTNNDGSIRLSDVSFESIKQYLKEY